MFETANRLNRRGFRFTLIVSVLSVLSLLSLLGCTKPTAPPQEAPAAAPKPAVELRVVVLDDPELAEGIRLLRGEWAERSGGSLTVESRSFTSELAAAEVKADLLIYPDLLLGELVEGKWLRPVRESSLNGKELALLDLFPLVRDVEMKFDRQTYGVSLGCQTLLLGLPQEYRVEYFNASRLIAAASAYSDPNSRLVLLFDSGGMKPRLQTEPFQRALEDLVAAAADSTEKHSSGEAAKIADKLAEPPAAGEYYSTALGGWQSQDEQSGQVTLLGLGGRLASVTAGTRNSTSAFQLLEWLASSGVATQLGGKSSATFPCRNSQVASALRWFPAEWPKSQAEQVARLTQKAMNREHFAQIPRIPGIRQYLELLDVAVEKAIAGELTPEEALQEAVQAWEQLTDRLGREQQSAAFERHLESL